ncbi:hypothetical protein CF319_g1927 [Tilletia indica]|nr:hypothetical protein CF319_g1927 [Tilletia indica]
MPVGCTIEWRAQNVDESQRVAADRPMQKAKDAAAKLAEDSSNIASDAASSASGAAAKVASEVASATSNVASAATDASTAAEPIASRVAAKASETVEQVSATLNHAAQKVVDAASAATDTVKGSTKKNKSQGDIHFDSVEDVIMSTKADHLLDSLASCLGEVTPGGAAAEKNTQQIALGAEKWLLEAVKFDEEKLGGGEDSTEDELEGQVNLST